VFFRKRKSRNERTERPKRRLFLLRKQPPYPVSDHCDGFRFHNASGLRSKHRVLAFLRWSATRHLQLRTRRANRRPVSTPAVPAAPIRTDDSAFSVTWVGHSTVMVRMEGLTLLTDPIWSSRCSPLAFAGPRRRQPPGIPFESLPPIDLVLVSHDHYDHLDLPTLRHLVEAHDPQFVVPLGLGGWLRRRQVTRVVELDWWESAAVGGVTVHAVPAQHFCGRTPWDSNRRLWAGFVVEGPSGRFYFAGDTGHGDHFARIGERFAPLRLAAIPIGAYEPRWFMHPVHIDPEQAIQAHLDVGSRQTIGIHFGTFRLTDEPWDEPEHLVRQILARRGLEPQRFWIPRHGETFHCPPLETRLAPAPSRHLAAAQSG
jgi:N-acyl-phosphatidylethanolamine-hydrolysing phospholipase D